MSPAPLPTPPLHTEAPPHPHRMQCLSVCLPSAVQDTNSSVSSSSMRFNPADSSLIDRFYCSIPVSVTPPPFSAPLLRGAAVSLQKFIFGHSDRGFFSLLKFRCD